MNAYYGTEAFLVAHRDVSEADTLITFFTKDLGRVDAMAKGVRLAKSKLKGHLSLFSRGRIMLTPGREYWRLLDAENGDSISSKDHFFAQQFARFFTQVYEKGEADEELWNIIAAVSPIDTYEKLSTIKVLFLQNLGFMPAEKELGQFFTNAAIQFITRGGDASFLYDEAESQHFEDGINTILSMNHMVQ